MDTYRRHQHRPVQKSTFRASELSRLQKQENQNGNDLPSWLITPLKMICGIRIALYVVSHKNQISKSNINFDSCRNYEKLLSQFFTLDYNDLIFYNIVRKELGGNRMNAKEDHDMIRIIQFNKTNY